MPKSSTGAGSWQTCGRSVCGRAAIQLSVAFHVEATSGKQHGSKLGTERVVVRLIGLN